MQDLDIEKLSKMIEGEMLSPVLLSRVLQHDSSTARNDVARLMSAMTRSCCESVFDVLTIYPITDAGWSALPLKRESYLTATLTRAEQADIERQHFQEDRLAVEYLRELIRPGFNQEKEHDGP